MAATGDLLRAYVESFNKYYVTGDAREHAYRPPLATLVEALAGKGVVAVNDPKRVKCGAPDFVISQRTNFGHLTIGHIETKDVTVSLDVTEKTDQLRRYLGSLDNLVLTNYIEFRWYVGGKRRFSSSIGSISGGRLVVDSEGLAATQELISGFLAFNPQPITKPRELAEHMAKLTHIIRDIIIQTFETDEASDLLRGWRQAFAQVLLAGLQRPEKTAEFADMFAQTLSYGLFSARIMDVTEGFTREEAMRLVPRTNPFLRKFFGHIAGPELDDEPYAGFVDDLVSLLANADMPAILADFGTRTKQEDPVVHFYETVLAAYDPKLRESRGVYFTPEPVVGYIVRSVDHILKTVFGLPMGLADNSMVTVPNRDPSNTVRGSNKTRKTGKIHRVLVLDPAVGTATFQYAVIDLIRRQFMATGSAGMWSSYVREHLLPRIFGFELLMAPYAVAHFKLGLQLAGHDLPIEEREAWAYDFATSERIGVFLTNTLEPPHEHTGLPLFTQFVADETDAANEVKQALPIMVVLGNPPYSGHSANKGQWIRSLVADYKKDDPSLAKPGQAKWLSDDYVKFIRFAQWRVQATGSGIVAYISNNGYLDNPTFRTMRKSLLSTFDDIYIVNLHGSSKKKEQTPDDSPDENVFDIQQGVAIAIFVKCPDARDTSARVHYVDVWGMRSSKYDWLQENSVATTAWVDVLPTEPQYLFTPQDAELMSEYESFWSIRSIFDQNGDLAPGIVTTQDEFAISFSAQEASEKVETLLSTTSEDDARQHFRLCSQAQWNYQRAKLVLASDEWRNEIFPILYRPFDTRWTVYDSNVAVHRRERVSRHMLRGTNLALITARSNKSGRPDHFFCTNHIMETKCGESTTQSYLIPLYLYPAGTSTLFAADERRPNISPKFAGALADGLGLKYCPNEPVDSNDCIVPEDIFFYIYSLMHSPTYRIRYAEFLKLDFPRIPLTSNVDLFRRLVALGSELVSVHLLESPLRSLATFPKSGASDVANGFPKYVEATTRVYINDEQYFEGVPPEVWQFQVGGYQVCHKWLKDRRGRHLSFNDLQHYQQVVAALSETIRLMREIDEVIPDWPLV